MVGIPVSPPPPVSARRLWPPGGPPLGGLYRRGLVLLHLGCGVGASAEPEEAVLPCTDFADLLSLDAADEVVAVPIQPAFDLVELGDDWLRAHDSEECPARWADGHSDQTSSGWEGPCETDSGLSVEGEASQYYDEVSGQISLEDVQLRQDGTLLHRRPEETRVCR